MQFSRPATGLGSLATYCTYFSLFPVYSEHYRITLSSLKILSVRLITVDVNKWYVGLYLESGQNPNGTKARDLGSPWLVYLTFSNTPYVITVSS